MIATVFCGVACSAAHEVGALQELDSAVEALRVSTANVPLPRERGVVPTEWAAELTRIDAALDVSAPALDAIGAPWMWTENNRGALESLVVLVEPELRALRDLMSVRGERVIDAMPRLMATRHRTNLLCGAALVQGDPTWLSVALDAAGAIDDGSVMANSVTATSFDVVFAAFERLEHDPRVEATAWSCELAPWRHAAAERHDLARRLSFEADRWLELGSLGNEDPKVLRNVTAELRAAHEWLEGRRETFDWSPLEPGPSMGLSCASRGAIALAQRHCDAEFELDPRSH